MELKELIVDAYTTPSVLVIEETASIAKALETMEKEGVRHLPVSRGARIVGLISDRDLKPYMLTELKNELPVSEACVDDIYTVNQSTPLLDVVFHMSEAKIGSAIVVDDFGKLVGIFTTTDALNALIEIIRGDYEEFIDQPE